MPKRKEEQEDIESVSDEDEGEEEILDEEECLMKMDDDDFMDMGNVLSALLTTEEGDNVCTALVKLNNTIQKQMETQNKILLKILTALNSKQKEV
jgi:hypothetical protein